MPQDTHPLTNPIPQASTPLRQDTVTPVPGPVTPKMSESSPEDVVLPPQTPEKYGGKKMIVTIFAIALLLAGFVSAVLLVQRQSLTTSRAWDCDKYVFEVKKDGTVTARNGSTRNEPEQKADVFINDALVQTFTVPALNAGQAVTLGMVTVPSTTFTWKVDGKTDCADSGRYEISSSPTPTNSQISAVCGDVKAYSQNWTLLSAGDLSKLKGGDVVYIAVSGTSSSGIFDKARFTINGTLRNEVTQKKPGTDEFYEEYTVPTGTLNFNVSGQVHHDTLGWI